MATFAPSATGSGARCCYAHNRIAPYCVVRILCNSSHVQDTFVNQRICFSCNREGHVLCDYPQLYLYRRHFQYFCDIGDAAAFILLHADHEIGEPAHEVLAYVLILRLNFYKMQMRLTKRTNIFWPVLPNCWPSSTARTQTQFRRSLPVVLIRTRTDISFYRSQSSKKSYKRWCYTSAPPRISTFVSILAFPALSAEKIGCNVRNGSRWRRLICLPTYRRSYSRVIRYVHLMEFSWLLQLPFSQNTDIL